MVIDSIATSQRKSVTMSESRRAELGKLAVDERGAAEQISVSVALMRKWRMVGGGPRYVKVTNRAVRYRVEDLEAFLRERAQ